MCLRLQCHERLHATRAPTLAEAAGLCAAVLIRSLHRGRCFRALVLSSRCESWRQNCTNRVSPTVTGWSGRVQSPTAPVSPTCLPVIPEQRTILNFIVRNGNPAALNKHPHPVRLCSKWCGRAVPLRAATRAILVHEMTIDIVRTDRRGPKKNNEGQPQSAPRTQCDPSAS